MLTYDLSARGALPMYEYLAARIREDVLSGALPAGEKLPSRRALSEHLGVSVITVEAAYAQLEAEGCVVARPRRGYFVAEAAEGQRTRRAAPKPRQAREGARWRLDLRGSRVDPSSFPAAAWARLARQPLRQDSRALLSAVPHEGFPELRQAIADYLAGYKGMDVPPERIVIGAGAEFMYIMLAQLLGPGARIAVEDPGYPKIRQVYSRSGAKCLPLALSSSGIEPEALYDSGARAVHISPSHQFPTGLITPVPRRQALLRWAGEAGGYIIEDDYDSELRFTGKPLPTLQSIDGAGRVIYMNTFSQTISPSMRLAYMALPEELMERWRRELGFYSCTVPALEQQVLARFLAGGEYERHLSRMRKEYRARRAEVLSAFRSAPFADRIEIVERGAGLHFLLRLDTQMTDAELRSRAEGLGVRLGFLSDYCAEPREESGHTLVISYAGLGSGKLDEAVGLLSEVFGVR